MSLRFCFRFKNTSPFLTIKNISVYCQAYSLIQGVPCYGEWMNLLLRYLKQRITLLYDKWEQFFLNMCQKMPNVNLKKNWLVSTSAFNARSSRFDARWGTIHLPKHIKCFILYIYIYIYINRQSPIFSSVTKIIF